MLKQIVASAAAVVLALAVLAWMSTINLPPRPGLGKWTLAIPTRSLSRTQRRITGERK